MSPENGPVSNLASAFTDNDLREVLRRALRTVRVLGLLLFLVFTFTMGWRSGLMELAGAAISYTGIREWRSLALAAFASLDNQKEPKSVARTLVMFFLRLGVAVAILYVSLRCLNGSVYALVAGIGLAVVALSIEAIRLLRN